ncbi:aldo/keto reductase [Bacillus sp. FJAT-27264]|uniref:aldo/keto reductase n=1 Tax=Paenibacillus sp. (strain DSM 101736 / FJAT-27264) TaxID=1850362 RepID=UPI000B21F77C|nr:aldo/keto reductase [Bacillus sp. FJAT-27264]
MGGSRIFGNDLQKDDLLPVFNRALQHGFTLWDTAPIYGLGVSESILGEFIMHESDIVVSTKFTPIGYQLKSKLRKTLDTSLSRLGVSSADIYWIHNPKDVVKWTKELIPLMKRGLIKHAGVSNHNLEEIKVAARILEKEGLQLSAVQNHYSLLYRASEEAGIIDWCHRNNVVFFSYMTLEQGALTGRNNANNPFKKNTRRGNAFNVDVLKKLEGLIKTMTEIGDLYGVEPAQIAMAWAVAKGTVPIIGITKVSHVDGALASLNVILSKLK